MSYSELVHEAFIEPIRSVLIVDDEYPTWDSVLSNEWEKKLSGDSKAFDTWKGNQKRVSDTVSAFRRNSPSMIVDIDDGKSIDTKKSVAIAEHLHQSDLLILDYQLDGREGDGKKSIALANKILENDHFNLIVVHTTEDRVTEAFENLVISLISEKKIFPQFMVDKGLEVLNKIANENADDPSDPEELKEARDSLVKKLKKDFLRAHEVLFGYLNSKKSDIFNCDIFKRKEGPLGPYIIYSENELNLKGPQISWLGAYILKEVENELSKGFSSTRHRSLCWSDQRDNGIVSWIRSNKGFIAFASKTDPTSLMDVLQNALENWGPTPSRLLSARMRSEIDKQGVVAEDAIFADNLVFRKFYEGLSSKKAGNTDANKHAALESQVKRHMESLGDQSADAVITFGRKILKYDTISEKKPGGFIGDYGETSSDDLEVSRLKYNSYICTKNPSGLHLGTGQIFTLKDLNKASSDYWVCLSPLCDMVPGQRKIGIENIDSNAKPFFAVKLESIPNGGGLTDKQINSNEYVFLDINGKIKVKSIYANSFTNEGKDPHWRMFFAQNSGWFDGYEKSPVEARELNLQWLVSDISGLTVQTQKIKIEWQLRYEYALNLNQKLGSNLTRVGLDFIN